MTDDSRGMNSNYTPFEELIFDELGLSVTAVYIDGDVPEDDNIIVQRKQVADMFGVSVRAVQKAVQYGIERGVIVESDIFYQNVETDGGMQSVAFLSLNAINYVGIQARAVSENVVIFQKWALRALREKQLAVIRQLRAENKQLSLRAHYAESDLNARLADDLAARYPEELNEEE